MPPGIVRSPLGARGGVLGPQARGRAGDLSHSWPDGHEVQVQSHLCPGPAVPKFQLDFAAANNWLLF